MICCQPCADNAKLIKAQFAAPQSQWVEGVESGHINWIPICLKCKKTWFKGTPKEFQIPCFKIEKLHHKFHPDHNSVKGLIDSIS